MSDEHCKIIELDDRIKELLVSKLQDMAVRNGNKIEVLGMIAANTIAFPNQFGLRIVWDEMIELQREAFGEGDDIQNNFAIRSWDEFRETVTEERIAYNQMYPGLPWRFDTIVFRVL